MANKPMTAQVNLDLKTSHARFVTFKLTLESTAQTLFLFPREYEN